MGYRNSAEGSQDLGWIQPGAATARSEGEVVGVGRPLIRHGPDFDPRVHEALK